MTEFDQEEAKLQLQRNGIESPTSEQICMEFIRKTRNALLSDTDWTQYRDVSLSNDSDWQTYRQSLRDLPQNFSPIIDIITEDGYPIVKEQTDWPEKPS
tara:strand:- start:236 stop:532 length:297 start_codon:yes stop_codon:yes gene_type:complete